MYLKSNLVHFVVDTSALNMLFESTCIELAYSIDVEFCDCYFVTNQILAQVFDFTDNLTHATCFQLLS